MLPNSAPTILCCTNFAKTQWLLCSCTTARGPLGMGVRGQPARSFWIKVQCQFRHQQCSVPAIRVVWNQTLQESPSHLSKFPLRSSQFTAQQKHHSDCLNKQSFNATMVLPSRLHRCNLPLRDMDGPPTFLLYAVPSSVKYILPCTMSQ